MGTLFLYSYKLFVACYKTKWFAKKIKHPVGAIKAENLQLKYNLSNVYIHLTSVKLQDSCRLNNSFDSCLASVPRSGVASFHFRNPHLATFF